MFAKSNLSLAIILSLFFLQNTQSQSKQAIALDSLYSININKYLLPAFDTTEYTEIIRYIKEPSFKPEYSIRIIKSKKKIKLEVFIFTESFQSMLMKGFIENSIDSIKPNILNYTVKVSENLTQKMKQLFLKTINEDISSYNSDTIDEVMLDGINYYFQVSDKTSSAIKLNCPKQNSISYKTTLVCASIVQAMQNDNFNEQEIINNIDVIIVSF